MIETKQVWSLSVVASFPGYASRGFCVIKDFNDPPKFIDPVTGEERDYRFEGANRADFSAFKNVQSFRYLLAALGYSAVSWRYVNISSLVFRFSATVTNGEVLTLGINGDSDHPYPQIVGSTFADFVKINAALHSDHDYNDLFTQIAGWL